MASKFPIYQLASTNGDGTGTTNAVGNYSDAGDGATDFKLTALNTSSYYILERVIISISDVGAFDSGAYGNAVTLTNGITVDIQDADDVTIAPMTPFPIKTNGEWAAVCHDFTEQAFGQGDVYGTVRWTFSRAVPGGIRIEPGESLVFTLNDDFSGLESHRFFVQGWKPAEF